VDRRVLALFLGLLLSTAAIAGGWKTFLSPGPVHQSHDDFAGNCDSCHLVFDGVPDSKCLDCHEGIRRRVASGTGFHATATGTCIDCHGDHLGLAAEITKEPARSAFDHTATGFDLEGSHADIRCETCHDKPIAEIGALCGQCHEDAHESALGSQCQSCHQPVAWDLVKAIADHTLAMSGGHTGLGCDSCHAQGANLDETPSCNSCHEQAHDGTESPCEQCHSVDGWKPAEFDHGPCTCAFPGKHQTASCLDCHEDFDFSDTPTECSGCHLPDRPHDDLGGCAACHTATSWTENLFDHNKSTAFAIDGAHLQVSCVQCHTTEGEFGGAETDCASCHQAAGDEAHGDFGACETCHTTSPAWRPSTFDHATTGFALTGKHTDLPCQKCHADKVSRIQEAKE